MIEFCGNTITIDGQSIELPNSILEALEVDNNIVVIFDYMEFPNNKEAQNLVCVNRLGQVLWVAESPSVQNTNAYTNFMSSADTVQGVIAVNNFAGYSCSVCLSTGKLVSAKFTK